jgi:hypothetical protein
MATNDYRFSHPASPDDVQGTGWIQNRAGTGRGMPTERQSRGMAVRQGQSMPQQPQNVVLPLNLNDSQSFVNEVRPAHRNVALDAAVGGVLGAGLILAIRHRRGR